MPVITNNIQLQKFCSKIQKEEYIAVDTEFMRNNTYYPVLCLVQIASSRGFAIIDALSDITDFKPLTDILLNQEIVKVFHSARQDMEVLLYRFGIMPRSIFDTQIASAFIGLEYGIGYEKLVKHFLRRSRKLNKELQFSSWDIRPLTSEQLKYAKLDVVYLYKIYRKLLPLLLKKKRMSWLKEEMEVLEDSNTYQNSKSLYKKCRHFSLDPICNYALYQLIAWRENKAMLLDMPRKTVVSDAYLSEIATNLPHNMRSFYKINDIRNILKKPDRQEILNIISEVKQAPEDVLEKFQATRKSSFVFDKELVRTLKVLLQQVSEEAAITESFIATQDELVKISRLGNTISAKQIDSNISALKGWRYEIFGKFAVKMMWNV